VSLPKGRIIFTKASRGIVQEKFFRPISIADLVRRASSSNSSNSSSSFSFHQGYANGIDQ